MQNGMLNLACNSLTGSGYRKAASTLDVVPKRTAATFSVLTSCSRSKSIMASIEGWASDPHGYGLIDTPGSTSEYGLPNLPCIASASTPLPATWKNPQGPSRASGAVR